MEFVRKHGVFLVLFVTLLQKVHSSEWLVDDAIYITPEIESRSPGDGEPPGPENIRPGRCAKFKECYKIFFLSDRHDEEPTTINSALLDYILETSDSCQPENITATAQNETSNQFNSDPGEKYIWCPNRKLSLKPPPTENSPRVIVSKQEGDADGVFCAPAKNIRADETPGPGSNGHGERVVGGKDIAPGEAPYLVVMTFRGKQVCGGSIIDDSYILTAAHCVSHLKATAVPYLKLFIGDHDIKDPTDVEHQERNVSKIIYHKDFSVDTLHDDVAMIQLSEPISYTSTVSPVCLSDGTPPFDDGTTYGTLVGWGNTADKNGIRPLSPRSAELRIWKQDDCEEVYEGVAPEEILEKAFCAGGFQNGGSTDACRGDSGGPLTITHNNKVQQVGIVSFGIGCGRYPGVFTKVGEYQEWIDKHRNRRI